MRASDHARMRPDMSPLARKAGEGPGVRAFRGTSGASPAFVVPPSGGRRTSCDRPFPPEGGTTNGPVLRTPGPPLREPSLALDCPTPDDRRLVSRPAPLGLARGILPRPPQFWQVGNLPHVDEKREPFALSPARWPFRGRSGAVPTGPPAPDVRRQDSENSVPALLLVESVAPTCSPGGG